MRALVLLLWSLALALGSGCGDDDDDAADADADADADGDGDEDEVVGDEECGACAEPPECSDRDVPTCCQCNRRPTEAAFLQRTRCGAVEDDCGDGAPDLSCFAPEGHPVAGASEDVILYGVVDVFGNGQDADDITIEVFLPGDGCGDEPGELLATTVADVERCPEELDEARCREEDPNDPGEFRNLGYFELEDPVPSETLLAMRTSGNPQLWKDLVLYNLYFHDQEIEDGRTFYEARVLAFDDYRTIPVAAGIPTGVTPGHGVLAGEVHDCGDVRLSFAQVATDPPPPAPYTITYFNDDADDPLPVAGRTEGTGLLGLWAAFDLPPGPARITSVGALDGDGGLVSVGWFDACVFADTVSAVTLRGIRPSQIGTE